MKPDIEIKVQKEEKVEHLQKKKINLPNQLVLLRLFLSLIILVCLLLIPYSLNWGFYFILFKDSAKDNEVLISYLNIICLFFFIFASFTDYLDGYLARKNDQITTFGKLFDPIADKILVNTTLIFFAAYAYIPIWVVSIFIARDIFVEGLRMNLASKNKVLAAGKSGKIKTSLQIIAISCLFIFHPEAQIIEASSSIAFVYDYAKLVDLFMIPLYLALFFSLYSGFFYFKDNWKEIFYEQ